MNRPAEFDQAVLGRIPNLTKAAWVLSRNGTEVEDLVQETVAKAMNAAHQFQEDSNLDAWLYTILRNTFRGKMRKFRESEDIDDRQALALPDAPRQEHHMELEYALDRINELPAPYRDAILMLAQGYELQDAAEKLGIKYITFRTRVYRARKILAGEYPT